MVEIFPASRDEHCIRVEFFGDEIDRIREVDALTGEIIGEREHVAIFPASHFVTREEKLKVAIENIEKELEERLRTYARMINYLKHSDLNNGHVMI